MRADGTADGSERSTVFVSDLHFGVGREGQGWSPYEDFRWHAEFKEFLAFLESRGDHDLVFLGDTFELWQSLERDCIYDEADLGCTEREALGRIGRAIAAHRDSLEAIGAFARAGRNRVVIVPGNHDAALFWPSVQQAVLSATGAAADRISIESRGYWLSADQMIYGEHGQQIGKEVNRFDKWPGPFVERNGVGHLQRTWGEKFVQDFYNRYEHKYPIIDNIAEESVGIRYGVKAEGVRETSRAVRDLLGFFLFDISSKQFGALLGGESGDPPHWDVKAVRAEGDRALIEALGGDPDLRLAAERAAAAGELPLHVSTMSDAQIEDLCDTRAASRRAQEKSGLKVTVAECPLRDRRLGAAGQNLFGRQLEAFRQYLESRYQALRAASAVTRPFRVFVYGHTHAAKAPFRLPGDRLRAQVVNTGAWQRVISPLELQSRAANVPESEVLQRLNVEDLPPCYSFIEVAPYKDSPSPQLRYWRQEKDRRWSAGNDCTP